jgi:uncharacterized protein with beta-barrel porin domain
MTSSNRRHLARVRNAFLGATALAGVAILAPPASAVVINDNFTPNDPTVVDDGGVANKNVINGVGQMVIDLQNGFIGLCTVSLINPRTVIFASHCVNENASETAFKNATTYGAKFGGTPIAFFFNTNNNVAGNSSIGHWLNGVSGGPKYQTDAANNAFNSNFVTYNTNCCTIGLGNNFLQSDVAMAALDTPAIGIPTWTLLFSPLTAPTHSTIDGYGTRGTGTAGANGGIDFKRRIAENVLSVLGSLDDQDTFLFGAPDGLPANLYMMDFNDPKFNTAQANQFDFNIFHDQAYTHEGITAPGDSGGPLIIDHQFAAPTIAAVLSGGDRFYLAQPGSSYGTTSFYQPLYLYWDWIVANNPYKYVGNKAGNGLWTDPTHWVINLDPAYMTIGANGQLVNALPTTPAQGQANIPPGFGTVCYFDDCVNIVTGAHTNPTLPAGPNPAGGEVPAGNGSNLSPSPAHVGAGPFGGLLGQDGFDALVASYVAANSQHSGGPEIVSASSIDGTDPASQPAVVAGGADGSILSSDANALSNWTNPENSGTVGAQTIIGLPGTTLTAVPNNFDGNPATAAPARYYDVTLAADGITTLSGASVVVDKLTVNGAATGLTIAAGATLGVNIVVNSFAGTTQVDGTLNSPNGVQMFGGVLQGSGTVNAAAGVAFLLGAVAPGTPGTVGTLTINGPVMLGAGSATIVDVGTTSDLLKINGAATVGGTLVVNPLITAQLGQSYTVLQATSITGSYNAVTDTLPGVLFPTVAQVGQTEVVTIQAGSFVTLLNGAGTPDQTTVAAALDAARGAHYNDLLALYQSIDPLSGTVLSQALENLAPDALRTAPLVGDMTTTSFDNMLWQHMGDVGGGANPQTAGLTIDSDGLKSAMANATPSSFQSMQLLSVGQGIATNPGGGNQAIATTGTAAAASPVAAEGMWLPGGASGFLSGSALSGSVAVGGGGGRADVRGLVIGGGLDMPVGDGFTVGAGLAYSDASAVLRASPSSLQTDSIQGGLYVRYDFEDAWMAEAFGAYGHQTMTTRRLVVIGPSTFALVGHTGGDTPSAGVYVGRSFHIDTINGAPVTLTPNLSLTYLGSEVDPFTETGGAPAMTFAGFSEQSLASRLGIDAKIGFDLGSIKLLPNVRLAWVENFSGNNGSIQAAFAGAPGSIMTFAMIARDRSYGELGFGLDADLGEFLGADATLTGRYDANTRSDVQYGAWTGRLTIHF